MAGTFFSCKLQAASCKQKPGELLPTACTLQITSALQSHSQATLKTSVASEGDNDGFFLQLAA
ncbi:hypothetical protein [Pseudomonas putida]|uniref:hypothetical protein n=1 Tax=Pseudomonas TaxID=286 RepID=UPI00227100E5|nr:hypothetical protein [Pseudomonas putida]WAB97794.1 hypothetical protein OSW16_25330 [Pseudomonas putida]